MRTRDRAGVVTLVVCLVVVAVVSVTAPDPATDARRAWDDVGVGTWGQMDDATLRVDRVRTTRSAVTASDRTLDSAATFVLVDYTTAVTGSKVLFSEVALGTRDDHAYEPRLEFGGTSPLQPGFTRKGTLVFEVPDGRVQGSTLLVDPDGAAFDVYSRAIRVDLGLGAGGPAPGTERVADSVVEVTR